MQLHELCDTLAALPFPAVDERAHPDHDTVRAARARVQVAVADDDFLADCIAWELRLLASARPRRGLVPFFTLPTAGIRFAFGYWPPGGSAGAHEHTAWTITAVCRNELEVLTYDRHESYRRGELVPKNRFAAPAKMVGYIYEPSIHNPINTSREWSLSLHVISPRDGEPAAPPERPLPGFGFQASTAVDDHPYSCVVAGRQREAYLRQLARILASMDVSRSPSLLAECRRLAATTTARWIDGLAPADRPEAAGAPWILTRAHADLVFGLRDDGDTVSLEVETAGGWQTEFIINKLAHEAMAFVTHEPSFDLHALPGNLTDAEREAIGEALEDTGLFRRVRE